MSWALAAAVAAGIVVTAFLLHALARSGAIAAWIVGTLMLGLLGWRGGAVLLVFFAGSSVVGRLVGRATLLDTKGERRDAAQVLANGGAAVVGALVGVAVPAAGFWLASAALAAAAADTWATAWGSGSRTAPRSILTGIPVPPSTSGGISARGTVGGMIGALSVAIVAVLVTGGGVAVLSRLTALGTIGMLLDSLLGAALQARFRCPRCALPSEQRRHTCGAPTELVGGVRWIDNDVVNLLATSLTLGLAWLLRTS